MAYQRLLWHSGLTYRCVCPNCRQYTVYTDYNLGFRAWFPDGFVYCATCRRPVRHNENNAIKEDGTPYFPFPIRTPPPPGYSAYPIEYLALNPQYVPQPGAQPNVQQPYPPQQPYPQQQYAQPNSQQQYPQQQYPQQQYPQPPEPPVQQTVAAQQPQPSEGAADATQNPICPNCGHQAESPEALFCTFCGGKLES